MKRSLKQKLTFTNLAGISPDVIMAHMSDPRVKAHMPLLNSNWDRSRVLAFLEAKEAHWRRDGLGHWAILCDGAYAGWGGFERDGDAWEYGLVLRPQYFGIGLQLARKAIRFAQGDERIHTVTFLLPPSRKKRGALNRIGATYVGEVELNGTKFLKYCLDTR